MNMNNGGNNAQSLAAEGVVERGRFVMSNQLIQFRCVPNRVIQRNLRMK